jgi:citrate synthase
LNEEVLDLTSATGQRDDVVSVAQAARMLGVKTATVYAYISRGQLSSSRLREDRRSWLRRTEVEEFGRRRGARPLAVPAPVAPAPPAAVAERPLTTAVGWLADDDRLLYRGHDAAELALTTAYEGVAELLWTGSVGPGRLRCPSAGVLEFVRNAQSAMPATSMPLDRLKTTAILLGAADPFRYDLSRPAVLAAARTLPPAFVASLPARSTGYAYGRLDVPSARAARKAACPGDGTQAGDASADLTAHLWSKLATAPPTPGQRALLSAALVLLADHGLGPSTRAAREAAASAADPYSVVLAGTTVASGLLLGGGSSLAVQACLEEIDTVSAVPTVLAARLIRGDRVSGFGQPRYRGPDPRAAMLLDLLARSQGDPERQDIVRAVVAAVRERRDLAPNAEFALGAICFVHGMPRGAGEAIFVIARSAGWIAHAVEEYESAGGVAAPFART